MSSRLSTPRTPLRAPRPYMYLCSVGLSVVRPAAWTLALFLPLGVHDQYMYITDKITDSSERPTPLTDTRKHPTGPPKQALTRQEDYLTHTETHSRIARIHTLKRLDTLAAPRTHASSYVIETPQGARSRLRIARNALGHENRPMGRTASADGGRTQIRHDRRLCIGRLVRAAYHGATPRGADPGACVGWE